MQYDVRVRRPSRPARRYQNSATHAEVNHHRLARIKFAEQIFAAATSTRNHDAREPVDQGLAAGAPHSAQTTDLDAFDASADNVLSQPASNGFDLG